MDMAQTEWEASITWSRVVAACLVKQDGKYLMVQEAQKKAYGLWNVPAGHVDKGETIESAAVREAKEETGYTVELKEKIALYHEDLTMAIKHVFRAEVISGEAHPQEGEILDVKWLTFGEVSELNDKGKLRFEWVWDIIQKDHKNNL